MAENLDSPSFGNFSIENTMEMGMGNAELLNDLMSPETASADPNDIKEIKDEPAPAKQTEKKDEPKKDEPDNKKSLQEIGRAHV